MNLRSLINLYKVILAQTGSQQDARKAVRFILKQANEEAA